MNTPKPWSVTPGRRIPKRTIAEVGAPAKKAKTTNETKQTRPPEEKLEDTPKEAELSAGDLEAWASNSEDTDDSPGAKAQEQGPAHETVIYTLTTNDTLRDPKSGPAARAAVIKRAEESLPSFALGSAIEVVRYVDQKSAKGQADGTLTGILMATIKKPYDQVSEFLGSEANLNKATGKQVWGINLTMKKRPGKLTISTLPNVTRVSNLHLTSFQDFESTYLKDQAAKRAEREAKAKRTKQPLRPFNNYVPASVITDFVADKMDKMIWAQAAKSDQKLQATDLIKDLAVFKQVGPAGTTFDVNMVFHSGEAHFAYSRVLAEAIGGQKVTTARGDTPWFACDRGCCHRRKHDEAVDPCPREPAKSIYLVSIPQGPGKRPLPLDPGLYAALNSLDGVEAHYTSQRFIEVSCAVIRLRLSGNAGKKHSKTVKSLGKKYKAKILVMEKLCMWCGDHDDHYTHEHWKLHPEDPYRRVIDVAGIALRKKPYPEPCGQADQEEPCEDDGCTKGHHNCAISTNTATKVTTKERLTKPQQPKGRKENKGRGQTIEEGSFIHQQPGRSSADTKYNDLTVGEPMNNRDFFEVAQAKDPAMSLQTGSTQSIELIGDQACKPNVFAVSGEPVECPAVEDYFISDLDLGSNHRILLLSVGRKAGDTLAAACGLHTEFEARNTILGHPHLQALADHLTGKLNTDAAKWVRCLRANSTNFLLAMAATTGFCLVVYKAMVHTGARPTRATVTTEVYGDMTMPMLAVYQRQDVGRGGKSGNGVAVPIFHYNTDTEECKSPFSTLAPHEGE